MRARTARFVSRSRVIPVTSPRRGCSPAAIPRLGRGEETARGNLPFVVTGTPLGRAGRLGVRPTPTKVCPERTAASTAARSPGFKPSGRRGSLRRSELPALGFDQPLEVDALDVEVIAHVRDLRSVRLELLLCDDATSEDLRSGNDEGVGRGIANEHLMPTDQLPEVIDLEDLGDKLQLVLGWAREQTLVCIQPLVKVLGMR